MEKSYRFETLEIHAGLSPDSATHSRALPIYQTTAYTFDTTEQAEAVFNLKQPGNIYTRLTNPTNEVLEKRVAALEGGVGACAFASGHAAIAGTVLNLCEEGDEFVSSKYIYGGAVNLFGNTLKKAGIKVRFVDPDRPKEVRAAINEKTRGLFVESIGNPNANVADLEMLASISHEKGVPLIVDNTFATPYLLQPIRYGADIVIHSASKFLNGHSNSLAGIVVDSGNFVWKDHPKFTGFNLPDEGYHGVCFAKDFGNAGFIERMRAEILRDFGAALSPFNAFLTVQGIETLSLRMRAHSDNALRVARYLSVHDKVEKVNYPGLSKSPYYAAARKYLPRGCGSIFTFQLKGGRRQGAQLIDALELFSHVANVGDVRSLVIHPGTTTHSQLSDEQLKASGITPSTVRISVGIEHIDDLIRDLEQALEKVTPALYG